MLDPTKRSPFAWTAFRQPFIEALEHGRAAAFVDSWKRLLATAIATAWAGEGRTSPDDLAELSATFRSLIHLQAWWLPDRESDRNDDPAQRLAGAIQGEIHLRRGAELASSDDPDVSPTERRECLDYASRLAKLAEDALMTARIAARLVSYDPTATETSPNDVVESAIDAELALILGGRLVPPKRTDLGRELRRRLELPKVTAERRELDVCLKTLTPEQREFIQVAYTDGYKVLEQRGWSGQRMKEVGQSARTALVLCMPQLARFGAGVAPAKKRARRR